MAGATPGPQGKPLLQIACRPCCVGLQARELSACVAHLLLVLQVGQALPAAAIDPPTISMTFSVNDSPLAGREGTQVGSVFHNQPSLWRFCC